MATSPNHQHHLDQYFNHYHNLTFVLSCNVVVCLQQVSYQLLLGSHSPISQWVLVQNLRHHHHPQQLPHYPHVHDDDNDDDDEEMQR